MKIGFGLVAAAVVAGLTGCATKEEQSIDTECGIDNCTKFTVLHTNDNHGRFWENRHGEYGMAARKALVDQIRSEVEELGGQTLLLSGGDINTGVPESDLQDAEPDFIGMNMLGYDAMAVGNHEFDNPLSVLDMQRKWAEFPMLAANIYKTVKADDATEQLVRYFEPYKIFDVNGLKVAVVGLTTEDTATIGNPDIVSDLTFTDPTAEMVKVIAEINAAKSADVIFATTHMGHYQDGESGSNAPGDVMMARGLEQGSLQAIFGGHSQNPVCMEAGSNQYAEFKPGGECVPDKQNGSYIMQAYEWGKYVGRADFEYYGDELHLASYQLIPVNLKRKDADGNRVLVAGAITPDQEVLAALKPFKEKGEGKLDEKIAVTDAQWERGDSTEQTKLGHLLAQSNRSKLGADFAVMNSGGIRASIEAGDVTYRDVLTVQPFGNMITLSNMTGSQVVEYLSVVATKQVGSGGYAQLSGIKMTVDCKAAQVAIHDINGKGFNADESYTFTVPSYSASGGDGYPKLNPVDSGYSDAEVLYGYLKEKGNIIGDEFTPVVGDITYINSESETGCKLSKQ
ncbi:bifunctional UDP-sugar hydrolase/5'-nucleotidase UshA [Aliivibrio kagoshimensis]|uniref:bifunctional UDP-sugar hydrolase/5'-nucleotidase UshA n=1 Tax=Aliivibrio kagoshimensis TaxID=2910230 RepID=UPI003D0B3A9D